LFKYLFILVTLLLLQGCTKTNNPVNTGYTTIGNKIYFNNQPTQFIGVNALHTFGAGSSDMNAWNIDIVREFVGNMQQQPVFGNVLLDNNGAYLHSLQAVVDSNRANKKVTIICPFRWNGNASTDFTGTIPSQTYWYNDCKNILKEWATHFKNQPDVWIEVWNEPYRYDRTDGYTNNLWLTEMNDLYSTIRATGNQNIIVIPCAEQGQDESVLLEKGNEFLTNKSNVLFDVHAYEKWLLVSPDEINTRLNKLQLQKLPIIFGEVAPMNAGVLMNPSTFLSSAQQKGFSMCAWLWKYDNTDKDALLDASGTPNNNSNNNWGSLFKNICTIPRNP
jgi:mannan endo-1,4-beta-mannosidase